MIKQTETATMGTQLKIMIVDDLALVRNGLEKLLNDDEAYEVVATAKNPGDALTKAQELIPKDELNLVFMDIEFEQKQQEGFDCAKEIMEISKPFIHGPKIIMLSAYRKQGLIERTKRAGIPGYLYKNCPQERLKAAIQIVMRGGTYYDEGVTDVKEKEPITYSHGPLELSDKEKLILLLIGRKKNNAAIADELATSEKTVERLKTGLYKKFDVSNAVGLLVEAIKQGFINPDKL